MGPDRDEGPEAWTAVLADGARWTVRTEPHQSHWHGRGWQGFAERARPNGRVERVRYTFGRTRAEAIEALRRELCPLEWVPAGEPTRAELAARLAAAARELRALRGALARWAAATGSLEVDPDRRAYPLAPPDPRLRELVEAETDLVRRARACEPETTREQDHGG